jgi:hypothetical protein
LKNTFWTAEVVEIIDALHFPRIGDFNAERRGMNRLVLMINFGRRN